MKIQNYFLIMLILLFVACTDTKDKTDNEESVENDTEITEDNENGTVVYEEETGSTEENKTEPNTGNNEKEASLYAYINDPDEVNPTNVRKTPSGEK